MAGQIRGIEIAIGADTSGVTRGLRDITQQSIQVSRNLNTVNSLLRLNPGQTELVAERQQLLAGAIGTTREKLNQLRAAQEDVTAAFQRGEISEEQYIAFQGEIAQTENRLRSLEEQAEESNVVLDKLKDAAHNAGEKLKNGLKVGAEVAAKAVMAVSAAVGAAVVAIGKKAIEGTAELEQNLGGSEAVFQNYALTMQKTAENAYKNMGLSQSEYLATANKMGALFQGTGLTVQQSSEMTKRAMQRAADMASVMGIDLSQAMESVAGAAKGNFTMMDNLGVAINDTTLKAYAEANGLRKLETAQDKVTVAMQYFLEQTEQYDGNFAREAEETISGSLGLLKSSWDNLVTGLGTADADLEKMTAGVMDALMAVVNNLKPVIERIVKALPQVVKTAISAMKTILPTIIPSLVDMVVQSLPVMFELAVTIIGALGDAIMQNAPLLIDAAMQIITYLSQSLIDNLPTLLPAITEMIVMIGNQLADNAGLLFDTAGQLIAALVDGIIRSLPILASGAWEIVKKIHAAIVERGAETIEAGVELVKKIGEGIKSMFSTISSVGGDIIYKIVEGAKALFSNAIQLGSDIVTKVGDGFKNMITQAQNWGKDLIDGIINGIKSKINAVKDAVGNVAETIKSYLHFSVPDVGPLTDYQTWMPDFMKGLAEGIEKNKSLVTNAMRGLANDMSINPVANVSGVPGGGGIGSQVINVYVTGGISNDMDINYVGAQLGRVIQAETTKNANMKGAWTA